VGWQLVNRKELFVLRAFFCPLLTIAANMSFSLSLFLAFSSLLVGRYYGQLETSKHKLLTLLDKSTSTVAREAAKLLSGAFCC